MPVENNTPRRRPQGLAAILFAGADAGAFLHGQLTVNVADLPAGRFRRAAYCSRQGRMQANGLLARLADDGAAARIAFIVCADIADDTAAHLRKFVLRAKVRVDVLPAEFVCAGAPKGAAGTATTEGDGATLSGETWSLSFGENIAADAAPDDDGWMRDEIERGVAWIGAQTRDKHIPQFVNFEALGGVDFDKGCYVGQEIIARLHYRGEVKRRALRLRGDGAPPPPVSPMNGADGATIGEVVNSAGDGRDGYVALAVTLLTAAPKNDDAPVFVGGAAARLSPPPYALPPARAN